ncbi:hypothetical protein [Streptomyces iconiensis]|uniref:Low molecular weight antigen MTB12-like C-terminal domain-containing protein n=1 Tax=Streptomyces iconiensis TaxID=1384038 RepID=A0ABT7A5Y7_9ACTN|nr:hypothetical protein [Streptomyces iconiensis]MDJ1136759.1 hypothetical protein [Streptomyces iconiensis]
MRRGKRPVRGVALAAVLVLGAVTGAAGCGDDSEDRASEPEPPPVSTPGAGPDDETSASDEGSQAGEPEDPEAAEKEVRKNWERFFDPQVSNGDKAKVLENGEQMQLLLEAFNKDERGRQVQAKVNKVSFTSGTEADVAYTLLLKKATALPDAKGAAVEQDDTWKVSVKTLCALVKLSGTDVPKAPGC